ncbi:tRNA (N6-isopentenyl adenosine(37)-C2)-methylthiotransferase MiaB [Candidatus Falkowbacteria bacterium]|nr:tRNA (N6-isopentenyl adenosine(37)-C2)-methylthiotransferase MiaB [Candidatus Falkowbacteria bacterium]
MSKQISKYHIITYGCQMNASDSERIAAIFEQYGCSSVSDWKEADVVIMNTCSIKQSAEDRVVGKARAMSQYKEYNPDLKVVITGCMAPRGDAVAKATGVDVVITIKDLAMLPQKLGMQKPTSDELAQNYFSIAPKYSSPFQVYIPIMTGCDNFCTFCVVPFTRGREYSRPMIDILNEVEIALRNGAREITLLGQNVNSYEFGFVELLKKINALPGDFWVRFVSSNPQDMSTELIDTIATSEKLCNYIHFAVQAGNNRILKRMNRRHTIAQYLALYDRMKEKMPDVGISTDIIVGFPSETDEEFQDTVRLMEQVKYDMAYISKYSARTNTPAWRMKDDVSIDEKKRREEVLTTILKRTAKENAESLVGQTRKVLVEKIGHRGQLVGKDASYRTVSITNTVDESLIGQFVFVTITKSNGLGVDGELVTEFGI